MNRDHRGNYIMCNEVSSTTQDYERSNLIIRPRHSLQYAEPGSPNSGLPQYVPYTNAELDLIEIRERLGEFKFENYFVEYILPMFEIPVYGSHFSEQYPTRLHFISGFCAVCVEAFKPNEMLVKMKCGHIFHWSCMYSWVLSETGCAACGAPNVPIEAPYLYPEYRSRTLELIKTWKAERNAALAAAAAAAAAAVAAAAVDATNAIHAAAQEEEEEEDDSAYDYSFYAGHRYSSEEYSD